MLLCAESATSRSVGLAEPSLLPTSWPRLDGDAADAPRPPPPARAPFRSGSTALISTPPISTTWLSRSLHSAPLSRKKSAASFIDEMSSSVSEPGAALVSVRCSNARPGSSERMRWDSRGVM
jgi:hypothetical protein